jgi:hypothetical protein
MVNGEERSVRVRGKAAGDDREREREREGERERKIFFLPCLSLLPPFGSCLPFASASLLSLGTAARDNREKGRRCLSLFRSLSPLPRSSRSSASFRPCLVPLALRCVLPSHRRAAALCVSLASPFPLSLLCAHTCPLAEDELDDSSRDAVENQARLLYGLVHARYIITSRGLAKMVSLCVPLPLLPLLS